MIKKLINYFENKRNRKHAFIINNSSVRSKPSEVFVLRQGLLYVLDDKIVHLTFDGEGVEMGQSNSEKSITILAYIIIIGCFLFVPIYAFAMGAWYLGIPYSLLLIPASLLYLRRFRPSVTPMILKYEVSNVKIEHIVFDFFLPYLKVETHENETFRIALGNGLYVRKSVKLQLEKTLLDKGYFRS